MLPGRPDRAASGALVRQGPLLHSTWCPTEPQCDSLRYPDCQAASTLQIQVGADWQGNCSSQLALWSVLAHQVSGILVKARGKYAGWGWEGWIPPFQALILSAPP